MTLKRYYMNTCKVIIKFFNDKFYIFIVNFLLFYITIKINALSIAINCYS